MKNTSIQKTLEKKKADKKEAAEIAQNLWDMIKRYNNTYNEKTLDAKPTGFYIIFWDNEGLGSWSCGRQIPRMTIIKEALRSHKE